MGKILPGQVLQSARTLLFAVFLIVVSSAAVPAQEAPRLPADKAAEYNSYISLGERYLADGKYREAIAEFNRALLLNPSSDQAKQGIIKANKAIAARSAQPNASDIQADRVNFHLTKGTEYYEEATKSYDVEKLDQAVAEWEQALQIEPDNKLARSLIESANRAKVDLLIEKGHDEFFAGNIEEAIKIWEEAKTLVPSSKVIDSLLAKAHETLHEREMSNLNDKFTVETQKVQEAIAKKGLLPEGTNADGYKYKDISLRPPQPELKQFGEKEAIVKELSQPVAFQFECESLRGVLKFLTEITGINILVDEEIFKEFGEEKDCYGTKVDRKEIFVTINVSDLPLESALNGMLRQHGLGFSIERDFIYVSTPDVLRGSSFEQLETRFYHLKDTSRISLPKMEATPSTTSLSLGGTALNTLSTQSIASTMKDIKGDKVQEIDPEYQAMSVPKLVNLLQSFVPVVLDQSRQEGKRNIRVGADKEYGGFEKGEDPIKLFESPRRLWADSSGREILSLIDFDPVTNTLIVRNTPSNLNMVEVFLDNLDQEPKQISVEAKFITYSLLEAKKVGIDLTIGGPGEDNTAVKNVDDGQVNFNLMTNIMETITGDFIEPTRGGDILFRFTKNDGNFLEATINMLSELGSSRIVSAPRLVTMQNKPAVIQDVIFQSFRTNLTIDTNITTPESGQTTQTQSVDQEFSDVQSGVSLSITPQIQYNNTIRLFILPNVSAIIGTDTFELTTTTITGDSSSTSVNTVTRPRVSRQAVLTNVVVNDGDTIVIGGLIKDDSRYEKTGVPFFEDIPLIGRLFQNETRVSDGRNLLIFITVNILDPGGVAYTRLN